MIKSKIKGAYGDARTGFKYSFILTKIVSYSSRPEGRIFTLENYLVDDNNAMVLYGNQFEKSLSNHEVAALDAYVESLGLSFKKEVDGAMVDLAGNEKEWAKIPHGLLYFVRTDLLLDADANPTDKTVFLLKPEDWELC